MGLDLAQRAVEDGHEVRVFRPTKHPIGAGFKGVKVVDDWRDSMAWAKDGLVVPTGNAKYTVELDRYRDLGFRIFGPTTASAKLEIDRAAGMEAMKAAGIDVPHYETFNTLDEAEAFARKADQAYVFKPLGAEDDKSLTYVSNTPADMVGWIQRQKARGMVLKGRAMLQEKIEMIAEVGISAWFGPQGCLADKYQLCWEHKKLMNGEIGPNTGEQGTVCQYVENEPLADQVLEPMEKIMMALGHRGDFAVNCGIDAKGKAWPFEFTCRLGWPAFFIQTASHKGDCVQWMYDLMNGEDTLRVDRRTSIGVVMSQPPFPQWNGKPECVEGIPVCGIEEVWDQAHPAMMQIGRGPYMDGEKVKEGPAYQTAGELVCVMTGLGEGVAAARNKVYSAVEEVSYSDRMFRTDIGEKLEAQLPKLHRVGIAKAVSYD